MSKLKVTTFDPRTIEVSPKKKRSFKDCTWEQHLLKRENGEPIFLTFKDVSSFGLKSFKDKRESFTIKLTIKESDQEAVEKIVSHFEEETSVEGLKAFFHSENGAVMSASVPSRGKELYYAVNDEGGKWVRTVKGFESMLDGPFSFIVDVGLMLDAVKINEDGDARVRWKLIAFKLEGRTKLQKEFDADSESDTDDDVFLPNEDEEELIPPKNKKKKTK